MADTGSAWNDGPSQNAEDWKNQKRPEVSVSLDDVIAEEKAAKKQAHKNQQPGPFPTQQTWNYGQYSTAQIKDQLQSRGHSVEGTRDQLIERLEGVVKQAWDEYYQAKPNGKKRTGKKRRRMTEEERTAQYEQREEARKAKMARKAANKQKMEEDRERKRQKKEAKAAKQREMESNQKKEKEKRQRSEAYVKFDMKNFEKVVRSKLDPEGTTIKSCSYDFAKKGFKVTFHQPEDMNEATSGSSYRDPKKLHMETDVSIFQAPMESCCAFFLYPSGKTRPNVDKAQEWVNQTEEGLSELRVLDLWCQAALDFESNYGCILNVYRERGFMVIHFQSPENTDKFVEEFSENGEFNGVPFVYLKKGTPTKKDKLECTKLLGQTQK